MPFELANFLNLLPEVTLLLLSINAQIFRVFFNKAKIINSYTLIVGTILVGYFSGCINHSTLIFNNSYKLSPSINLVKIIIYVITLISIATYQLQCKIANIPVKVEYLTLSFLSCLGIFIALSSCNLLLLFCGLELQSIAVYALISFYTNNFLSFKSTLKYFISSVMISCISLLGIFFVYGYGGSLRFADIGNILNLETPSIGVIVGVILLMSNLFFRLAVPLHFWTPNVYNGLPMSVIIFFNGIAIGLVIILSTIFSVILEKNIVIFSNIIKIIAILLMIIGSCGTLKQDRIKKIIAYSTVLNMGVILLIIVNNSTRSINGIIFYATTYSLSITGIIIALIMLVGNKAETVTLEDLIGSGNRRKAISASLMLLLFSIIGLPPFAGFFAKFYIIFQILQNHQYLIVLSVLLTDIVASYCYLKIIRYIYFDKSVIIQENRIYNFVVSSLLVIITSLIVLFSLYADSLYKLIG